ncbi:MAG: alpha-L-fucosidase [bacterium]|nr:alpha-L-fucosidase [bacterium]
MAMKPSKQNWITVSFLLVLAFGVLAPLTVRAADDAIIRATPEQIDHWRDLRFGMFIHWGPVSLTGKEIGWSRTMETTDRTTAWKEYDQLYKRFNPEQFNADEWVSVARDAGMKYIVFTSKHHDGFVNWDSDTTDHDVMSSPFHRDIMKELSETCKKQGMAFGPYYSICDWYQPDYGYSHQAQPGYTLDREPDFDRYFTYLKDQLTELQRRYGPFLVFWFDGEWEKPWDHEHGVELNNFCKQLQPDVLVNNRVDKGREGMEGTMKGAGFAGDFMTPEQRVGAFNREAPWETCMTICNQWAWKPNDPMKPLEECLRNLIYTAGGDGNLLFNVGPMPNGRIEERQVERLHEMGEWMKQYGEAIYGTRGGPYKPGEWGASTCKNNHIYLFVMKHADGKITLPGMKNKIISVGRFGGKAMPYTQSDGEIVISIPDNEPSRIATVIDMIVEGDAVDIAPMDVSQ